MTSSSGTIFSLLNHLSINSPTFVDPVMSKITDFCHFFDAHLEILWHNIQEYVLHF